MTLKEMRQQRANKAAAGKAKLAEYNTLAAIAAPTAEQEAQVVTLGVDLEALETDVAQLDAKIDAAERTDRLAGLFTPRDAVVPARSAGRTIGEAGPGMGGFRSMAELAFCVRAAGPGGQGDPRLAELNKPVVGAAPANFEQNSGAAGEGFLVPVDMRQAIWELVFASNDLNQMIAPTPTNSNNIWMPKDETTPWGATGVQAVWRAEASQLQASKIAMGQVAVQLHELAAFVIATNELMNDAPQLNDKLTRQAARAISYVASESIAFGDGNGKPLGFMASNALVTVPKDTGQATQTLTINNILRMMSRLFRSGGGSPFWLANPDVLPALGGLTIGTNPAWLPLNQPMSGSPWEGSLLGRPIMFSEHANTFSSLGDLILMNPDGYMLATKQDGGIDFASSIHLFFDYNMEAFRWIFRVGGQPYLSAPVQPAKGSNTKSHFVSLQAR